MVGVETSESVYFLYSVNRLREVLYLRVYLNQTKSKSIFKLNFKGKAILFKTRERKFRVNHHLEMSRCLDAYMS